MAVQAAKKAVVEERDKANHLEHLVRNLSIRKEWWRLPFVIAKVAKGNALSDSDALLWKMVLKNEAAYFSVTAENSFDMDSPFTNNPGHTIAALKLAEDESNLSRSGGGENNDKAAATTRAVVKKNRWGASVTRAKLPPLQRKNSLSVGIAALSSSLQRTLQGFYSSVSSSTSASNTTSISNSATTSTCCSAAASASAAAAQATAAQHMGAAVGLHFDSEVRPLVLPKPEPVVLSFAEIVLAHKHTKQNQQQQLQQLQSTGPDANAGADASAAFSVSQKVHSPHRRASRSLLNQEQPVAHMPQKAAPHHRAAASISPFSPFFSPSFSSSSSSSVHSHWTGQRVHDPPRRTGRSDASKEFSSEEQRQARRILNRLRGGKAATEKEEGQGSCSGNMCAGSAEKKNNDVDSVAPSTQVVLIKPSAALHGTKQRFSLHGTVAVAPTGTTNQ